MSTACNLHDEATDRARGHGESRTGAIHTPARGVRAFASEAQL